MIKKMRSFIPLSFDLFIWLVTWLLLAVRVTGTQDILQTRATGDICAIINHGAALVGGQLFISRGQYSFEGGAILSQEQELYFVNLSEPFTANANLAISNYKSVSLPSGLTFVDGDGSHVFLYDNTTLYFFDPSTNTGDSMWAYDVSLSVFEDVPITGGSNNPTVTANGGWASNPATGQSYYIGAPSGGLAKRTVEAPLLQILDSSTGDYQWLQGAEGGPQLSAAQLVFVRAGKAGVLVAFGGVDPNSHEQFASSTLGDYVSMRNINVFDIDSGVWYTVSATGASGDNDIPNPRISFCAAVSAAPDDSSFQITIYGGYDLLVAGATNEVHVLTIPTFQWLNVTSNSTSNSDNSYFVGRQDHQCVTWNDAQMVVVGGVIEATEDAKGAYNQDGCNSTHPPILVMNLVNYEWEESFLPNLTYSQPKVLWDYIGGDQRGLARDTAPPGGFNNTALASIFSQTVARTTAPTSFPTSSSPPLATPPNQTNTESGSGSHTGAIAGGVVGGVVGLAALVGAIWGCVRYRRRKQAPAAQGAGGDTKMPALYGGQAVGQGGIQEKYSETPRQELGGSYVRAPRYEMDGEGVRGELPSS